jgi:DNA processing protein
MTRARILLDTPPRVMLPTDSDWPVQLSELRDPPEQLHIAGRLPRLARAVAIVGTRFVDEDARSFARDLGQQLAAAGWIVVSGGAAGIDAAAHRGALDAGGITVAVLATGLERAFPSENAGLFAHIARSGALVSEFSGHGTSGQGWVFLKRNRLVAALASAVVIVQAPARSGALSTARWAKDMKRRVFAVPAAPWDPRGTGCLELLSAGAEICTSAADVLSLSPTDAGQQTRLPFDNSCKKLNDHEALPASARALWRWLRGRPSHPDQISTALDMPAAEVQEALLTLVLLGRCRQRVDGTYEATTV